MTWPSRNVELSARAPARASKMLSSAAEVDEGREVGSTDICVPPARTALAIKVSGAPGRRTLLERLSSGGLEARVRKHRVHDLRRRFLRRARLEGWLGVVLDAQLDRLCELTAGDPGHEREGHVDPRRNPRGGDDLV